MGGIGSKLIHSKEIDTTEDLHERYAKMRVEGDKVRYLQQL